MKVYSGDPEAYKARQEAKRERRMVLLASMAGRAIDSFSLTGDRWTLMRAVYALSEVCINIRMKDNSFSFCRYVLSWIGMLTPKEFMLVFPPSKEYKGEKIGMKDYFSTMEVLADYELDKQLGDRAIDFVFEYYNAKVCCLGAKVMMAVTHEHRRQTGHDILDDFMASIGKPPLTKYRMHTDSQGRQYAVGTDGSISRIKKSTRLHLVKK